MNKSYSFIESAFKHMKQVVAILASFVFLLIAASLFAQPSGGPYGPIPQTYEIPDVSGTIYYVSPDGDANSEGTSLEQPTTIESAFERVLTGDAIIMRGGVYRTGDLFLNQGILIQPYEDEKPVMTGTHIVTEWQQLRDGVWATSWDRLFPDAPQDWWRYESEGMKTPLHKFNNDMVFVDDKYLRSAGWMGELDEDKFFIDYDRERVYIGVDPTDRKVEITAYDVAIHRVLDELNGREADDRGFTMRGIELTKYAYRIFEIDGKNPEGLSDEADHGNDVVGTTLEHCTMSYGSRVAGYFRGDSLTIRNCKVSDTNTEGIFILSSSDVLLERNIFTRNNIENMTGYYPSAVKIFNQCYRVVCNDNLVIDHPNSNGIWYDVGNVDGVFTNNWIENVGHLDREFNKDDRPWPSNNAFFFEISQGATVAGNVFVNNDQGIFVLNASDVHIYNNTFVNSTLSVSRTTRSAVGDHFGWHPSTGPDVDERYGNLMVNNLLIGDHNYIRPLLFTWQTPVLCDQLTEPQLEQMDNNVYVKNPDTHMPVILWSPDTEGNCQKEFHSLDSFRGSFPQFAGSSIELTYGTIPLFKSLYHSNMELLPGFPGMGSATKAPGEVEEMIGLPKGVKPYVGAYPDKE